MIWRNVVGTLEALFQLLFRRERRWRRKNGRRWVLDL